MKYVEVTFTAQPCTEIITDVLAALTAEIGFESFVTIEGGMQAYIQYSQFDENALKSILADFPLPDTVITYTLAEPEDKDWNEEWEKNFFQPIVIEDRCVIHSTFHHDYPQAEYDIVEIYNHRSIVAEEIGFYDNPGAKARVKFVVIEQVLAISVIILQEQKLVVFFKQPVIQFHN